MAKALADFILELGDQQAAALFGVRPVTVQHWRLGWRRPSIDKAQQIVELTGGEVDLAGCYVVARRYRPSEVGK